MKLAALAFAVTLALTADAALAVVAAGGLN
jgi:hypothetical protein